MQVGDTAYFHFTVFDADGITPLTGQAGSVVDALFYNGAASAQPVTVNEIGVTGSYYASFVSNAVGDWRLRLTNPDGRVLSMSWVVENNDRDTLRSRLDIIEADTDEIQSKLPTNYIMGSSDQSDKDDEIDAILADTAAIDTRLPADPADESNQLAAHAQTQADIAALNDLSQADVQSAMTAQGYTTARAPYLDELAAANIPADVNTLLSRLTAGRAANLDEITAARLAELDAANIPADVDTLLSRLTAGRATNLDNLDQAISATEDNIRGADDDDLKDISDQIDAIPAAPAAGVIADAVWEEDTASHTTAGTYGRQLPRVLVQTAAVAGSTTVQIRTGLTQANNYWNGHVVKIFLAGGTVSRVINTYVLTNGAINVDALPAAPVGGELVQILDQRATLMDGAITVNKIATGAISATKIADNTLENAKFAAGAISAAKIASSAIGATQIASDAITAAKIAANAIGASELATDAVNKIRDAILSDSTPFSGANIATILTGVNKLLAALVAGTFTIQVGSSTTEVRTNATQADNYFDELVLVILDSSGVVARRVTQYLQTNGAFTVDPALPFTPSNGQTCYVLGALASSAIDVSALVSAIDTELSTNHGAGSWETGAGAVDWTAGEKEQIRDALGVDGAKTSATGGQLQDVLSDTAAMEPLVDVAISTRASPGDAMDLVPDSIDSNAVAPSGKAEIAAEVDSVLSGSHGAGNWEGADEHDWSDAEKKAIREALGVPGTKAGAAGGQLQDVLTDTAAMQPLIDTSITSRAAPGAAMTLTLGERAAIDAELSVAHGAGSWETAALTGDWSNAEKEQIRDALGVDGAKTAAAGGQLQDVLDDTNAIDTRLPTDPADESNQLAAHAATQAAIAGLNDLSVADVQTAMTNQGYSSARATKLDNMNLMLSTVQTNVLNAIAALNDLSASDVQSALTSQGYTVARASLLDNLTRLDKAISVLNDLSVTDVQTALTNQGYTTTRANLLNNLGLLDVAISSVVTAISNLNDLSQADVQAAMTAQGYTAARAALLSNLNASISSVLSAIAALNNLSSADVQAVLSAQGYTAARAQFIELIKKRLYNAYNLSDGDSGNLELLDDDDLTVLATADVTDKNGNPIVLPNQAPARKSRLI